MLATRSPNLLKNNDHHVSAKFPDPDPQLRPFYWVASRMVCGPHGSKFQRDGVYNQLEGRVRRLPLTVARGAVR